MSEQWTIWKDVCYPGRVHVPDARVPGKLHVYDFTADDMKALEKTGNTKIGDNWNIPVCWEHQDVGPAQLSHNPSIDQAKGVFARIRRFSRTPDGRLKAQLAGTDPEDLKQLEKVGFVSPEIAWDWTDTDGRVWRGPSITHLAATPRPVQRHQNPFGTDPDRVPEALNRVNGLESLVRMSFGGSQKPLRVAPTLRLSLAHYRGGLALGAAKMADEQDTGGSYTGDGKKSAWERIADSLAMCCVKIGDGKNIKDADHLADLVEVACLNRPQELPEEDDLGDEDLGDGDGDEQPQIEGDMNEPPPGAADTPPPPVQMSQNALAQRLIAEHRAKLVARAEKVQRSGVLGPREGDQLVDECRTCRLSLTATGDLTSNDTLVRLAAFESARKVVAPNTGAAKTRLSQNANGKRPKGAKVAPRSRYQENAATDADQIVEAWDQM